MSEIETPARPRADSGAANQSPAFVKAVAELGAAREVTTSQAIRNVQGVKLLEGGVRIDRSLYDRLVSHRLALPLDECIAVAAGVDSAALHDAARTAIGRLPFFARVVSEDAFGRAVLDGLASVELPPPAALHLTVARDVRPELFEHSVLMALLAARLAGERGGDAVAVGAAAAAGLLHDLGMLHIEPSLLASEERLSGDELKPVYVHPVTTSMLVDRFGVHSKAVVRAIVEHHERLDGSGYPRGLAGDAISPLGRILALAEVVTAMFDGQRRFAEQRVSLLLRINPRRYDPAHVQAVQKLLAATPPAGDDGIVADTLIARLLQLATMLELWRGSVKEIGRELEGALRALIASVDEQHETLQRMLYDAGVTPEQLSAIAGEVGEDATFRIELWALAEELLWQLHAAANQLRRRWQAAEPGQPHPAALATWFAAVAALDADSPPR